MNKSRRKQSNPSRLAEVQEDSQQTTSQTPSNSIAIPEIAYTNGCSAAQAKSKKFSDFSISALSNGHSKKVSKPSPAGQISPFSSIDFSAAQKAYEALLEGMDVDKSGANSCSNALSMATALFSSPFSGVNPFVFDPFNNPLLSLSKQVDGIKGSRSGTARSHPDWMGVKSSAKSINLPNLATTNGIGASEKAKSSHHRKRPASTSANSGIDLPSTSSKPSTEVDFALDLSVKKSCSNHSKESNTPKSTPSSTHSSSKSKSTPYLSPTCTFKGVGDQKTSVDALNKLSSLVTKTGASGHPFFSKPASNGSSTDMGHLSSLWFSNFDDKLDQSDSQSVDPSSIFTCLQCFERFQTMEQLVKHMEKTRHFNAPTFSKHLTGSNGSGNGSNARSTTASPSSTKAEPGSNSSSKPPNQRSSTPTIKEGSKNGNCHSNGSQASKSSKHNNHHQHGTFSFKCIICGHSSTNNSINEHMTKSHSFTSPNEWISAVKLIPL